MICMYVRSYRNSYKNTYAGSVYEDHCKYHHNAYQSMEWTGSIRWIHNPVQSTRIWIGLDKKFTNSADSGLDWIQKCAMCIPYLDLRQFLLIVTLTSEVLPSNLQLFTSSFVFTCRFYKVFGRYLLCCVRIGLDWIQILVHQLDWTGLGSVARVFGLGWIVSTRSIPYSDAYIHPKIIFIRNLCWFVKMVKFQFKPKHNLWLPILITYIQMHIVSI